MGKCGNTALDIRTYYAGLNQPTHPNIIAFDTPWHGYRYYMGYTPYPFASGYEENPSIAASNDLIHWEKPEGLRNPIATSEELGCDELKDSHLLYRADLDRLEMWYLGRIDSTLAEGGQLHCLRKVSADGRSWSNYEIMYSFQEYNLVSESVIYDGKYCFWGIRHTKEAPGLYFMRSDDGIQWSEPVKCEVPDAAATDMWHGTVICQEGQYHFVWVGYSGPARNRIHYADSADGIRFSEPQVIVENDASWEYLYRPCLLKAGEQWHCYYGVIRCDGKWMVSLSRGEVLRNLSGITAADLGPTIQPLSELIASSPRLLLRRRMKEVTRLVTPRLMILVPFLLILRLLQLSPLTSWLAACACGIGYSAIVFGSKRSILRGLLMGTISACIVAFLCEIFSQLQALIGTIHFF